GPRARAEAHELSGALRPLRGEAAELARSPDPLRRALAAPPERALGVAPRAQARARILAGRRAHLLPRGPGRVGGPRRDRSRARSVPQARVREGAARRALAPASVVGRLGRGLAQ